VAWKGVFPISISKHIIPIAHMSALYVYGLFFKSYGGEQSGVPQTDCCPVSSAVRTVLNPKSEINTVNLPVPKSKFLRNALFLSDDICSISLFSGKCSKMFASLMSL